jgi:stage III sporulation protein SpoIIIAA
VPKHKKATYLRIVAAYRPEKKKNRRGVRFIVGGDRIDYAGEVSTKTADLTTVKTFCSASVISAPNARFVTGDLKDFWEVN